MKAATGESDDITSGVGVLPILLSVLETLGFIRRHLHPPRLAGADSSLRDQDEQLAAAIQSARAADGGGPAAAVQDRLSTAADLALQACRTLRRAVAADDPSGAVRAFFDTTRAVETLYPLANALPAVSSWFLNSADRTDAALLDRLLHSAHHGTGVMHVDNELTMRGGLSMYVPEYLDPTTPSPLVVALHGGSGHGRTNLWTWIREARGRGLILVAPTSTDRTWPLLAPRAGAMRLTEIVDQVSAQWPVDPAHILLTGMSDGGTFTWVAGLRANAPFTHLAPVAASFHPALIEVADQSRTTGLPIYLVHGVHDWMFPVDVARMAYAAMSDAGARVVYREISDLSHAYPNEENERIIDWLLI